MKELCSRSWLQPQAPLSLGPYDSGNPRVVEVSVMGKVVWGVCGQPVGKFHFRCLVFFSKAMPSAMENQMSFAKPHLVYFWALEQNI
jgi:hypothetical protein